MCFIKQLSCFALPKNMYDITVGTLSCQHLVSSDFENLAINDFNRCIVPSLWNLSLSFPEK